VTHRYDDIIELPRHVSLTHAPMPQRDRAAQFSPFAALTGFEEETERTGREHIESYDKKEGEDPLNGIC